MILLALELPDGLVRRRSTQRSSRTWKPAGRRLRDQERMEEWLQKRREAWTRNRGEERRGSEVNPPVTLSAPEKPAHPVLGLRCTTGGALLGTREEGRDQDGSISDDTGEEELTSSPIPQLDGGDNFEASGTKPGASEDIPEDSKNKPKDSPKNSEDNPEESADKPRVSVDKAKASVAEPKRKPRKIFVHTRDQVGDWRAKYGIAPVKKPAK